MPFIEYECLCGKQWELMRRFSDDDQDVQCPNCGRNSPRRMVSLPVNMPMRGGTGAGRKSFLPR